MSSTTQDSFSRAQHRFWRIANIVYIIGFLSHCVIYLYFKYLGIEPLAKFNLFISLPVFILAFLLNMRRKTNIAFTIVLIELILHQIFGIITLGWNSGFQFLLIYPAILVFLNIYWTRTAVFLVALFVASVLSILRLNPEYVGLLENAPSAIQLKYFYISSIVFTLVLISITSGYFVRAANRSEQELEQMVAERTKELELSQKAAIQMLGDAGHFHDADTGDHIWRMAHYAGLLAKKRGWDKKDIQELELAAAMHDTGKIGIQDTILQKPGKLDADEWKTMQTHAQIGADILKRSNTPLFTMAADIALSHHEKWDGSGYPNQLKQTQISEAARIVAVADVFDALTTQRPYKEAWSFDDAFAELERCAGSHFDPEMVVQFLELRPEIEQLKR